MTVNPTEGVNMTDRCECCGETLAHDWGAIVGHWVFFCTESPASPDSLSTQDIIEMVRVGADIDALPTHRPKGAAHE